jgi:hypothetical protein
LLSSSDICAGSEKIIVKNKMQTLYIHIEVSYV